MACERQIPIYMTVPPESQSLKDGFPGHWKLGKLLGPETRGIKVVTCLTDSSGFVDFLLK